VIFPAPQTRVVHATALNARGQFLAFYFNRETPLLVSPLTLCPGDANGDFVVDNADLQSVLDGWASSAGDASYSPDADLDADGSISNGDLQQLLDNWAASCE
jgi:hypothetical protein